MKTKLTALLLFVAYISQATVTRLSPLTAEQAQAILNEVGCTNSVERIVVHKNYTVAGSGPWYRALTTSENQQVLVEIGCTNITPANIVLINLSRRFTIVVSKP
jgi:hypothetical protein